MRMYRDVWSSISEGVILCLDSTATRTEQHEYIIIWAYDVM